MGSGPGSLQNEPGFVDSHEVVVRVNNYKLSEASGQRCDVHASFYGSSIRKTAEELKRDGVTLCLAKCPDAHAIDSPWHVQRGKQFGVDFRPIYRRRAPWWFCDVYVPSTEEFLGGFEMLGKRIPTTGFSTILQVLSFEPAAIYLTGFDFFKSGKHNVDEPWRLKNPDDPIAHAPHRELDWLQNNHAALPLSFDPTLARMIEARPNKNKSSGTVHDLRVSR